MNALLENLAQLGMCILAILLISGWLLVFFYGGEALLNWVDRRR
jgi:hypothetical protein